jgi:hypothetical protein
MGSATAAWYELRNALHAGDLESAGALLRSQPDVLEARNGIGETVLHFLAVEDCRPAVAWLHERGARLDTTNEFGTPVLFEVAQLGYKELLAWLVAHGADPGQLDRHGQGLVAYLESWKKPEMASFVRELAGA